mmetsp:Transcript_55754/g.88424  ORF Transcript_55754/g.88424 Transcript_55754/m.88424 type:complete len:85 (-) Transcript_55754:8-262(-)
MLLVHQQSMRKKQACQTKVVMLKPMQLKLQSPARNKVLEPLNTTDASPANAVSPPAIDEEETSLPDKGGNAEADATKAAESCAK